MPNWSFGAGFTTSLGAESSWNADIWSKAAPQEFPVFVNSCQIDKTKVQNSDFMYAFCLKDNGGNWINKNTSGTINVQLEKAFAAVELVCTDGYEATDVTFEGNPIILGRNSTSSMSIEIIMNRGKHLTMPFPTGQTAPELANIQNSQAESFPGNVWRRSVSAWCSLRRPLMKIWL